MAEVSPGHRGAVVCLLLLYGSTSASAILAHKLTAAKQLRIKQLPPGPAHQVAGHESST